jgi:beta-alanine degradation protein BauB
MHALRTNSRLRLLVEPRSRAMVPWLAAVAILVSAGPAAAQDPVKLSPNMYRVLLENEHVRVLEFRAKPGEKEPMHSHPGLVAYALTDGKFRLTPAGGKSEERDAKAGTAVWGDAVTHAYENIGSTDVRVLVIEMKGVTSAKKAPAQ